MAKQGDTRTFIPPDDPDIPIWRYRDFTKFVSILEHSGLFFGRVDRLDDHFEGSFPAGDDADARAKRLFRNKELYEKLKEIDPDDHERMLDDQRERAKALRQVVVVNCWHMNEHESMAMWKLYANDGLAIAIESTYRRLCDTLDVPLHSDAPYSEGSVRIGAVRYLDPTSDSLWADRFWSRFLWKHVSFSHEREIRALVADFPSAAFPHEFGVWRRVNLHSLIERVYVAPQSPQWFEDLVRAVVKRYGLQVPVRRSSLDEPPRF